MTDSKQSLQHFIDSKADLVDYFYNDVQSPHSSYKLALNPAPTEWTNWREEQRAWRETAVLFDQSHHMPEMFVRGPDAFKLLNRLGVNSFAGFVPGKAKQFVGCNPRGQLIGECVLYYNGPEDFELVSGVHFQNWVYFHASTGGYDVRVERDPPTSENPKGRTKFRFGMDGPRANDIFRDVVEGLAPEIPFFNFVRVRIAGCEVDALRHGMAGHKGVELSGAFADGPKVREALLRAGQKHDLKAGGTMTYFSAVGESGWMAYPTPAVHVAEEMRAYREWLPADSWEARVQLGGSFRSRNIEDYYVTPWCMGYDRIVKFDHDFIGREALEQMADGSWRTAVSLVWNQDDLMAITRSMYEPGLAAKYFGYPTASYAFQQADQVLTPSGERVGLAQNTNYSINERKMISLAWIDREQAQIGRELVLLWGEPDGGSRKPHVERHKQVQVRVTIAPKPYASTVRQLRSAALA